MQPTGRKKTKPLGVVLRMILRKTGHIYVCVNVCVCSCVCRCICVRVCVQGVDEDPMKWWCFY